MTRNLSLLTLAVLLITACGGSTTPSTTATDTAGPPTFSVSAVIANFTDECRDPAVIDELFCEQVDIAGMTAEDEILYVPTTLGPEATDRGDAVCNQLVNAHFDNEGNDLGYGFVGILASDGSNLAACSVT